jgi:hypothetical protein
MLLPHLKAIEARFRNGLKTSGSGKSAYAVPNLLLTGDQSKSRQVIVKTEYYGYYLNQFQSILSLKPGKFGIGSNGGWTRDAVVYNMFVRATCAFDHDRNGKIDLPVSESGWRETGTFLKAIAMLPYIKSLGVNTVHLLPITAIGSDGNKGSLGSPYAIKNPVKLDENLGETKINLGVEEEFKAFVEAAHHMGIRVVVEFVFRTSAKDGDLIREHPEWFYWIKDEIADRDPGSHDESRYGNPLFNGDELNAILWAVDHGVRDGLPPPHQRYREMFTRAPKPENIRLENGRYIGVVDGTRVRIPGAFADWPPHDTQPPWGDVTYLKMYDHPDFNYIAYNTIRMYDARLARVENVNRSLWEQIAGIIPYYQQSFGIDGVMIDMGHALPMELKHEMIRRARAIDPGFAFWDENFSVDRKSVDEGYNAVIGYQWSDQHKPDKFKTMLRRFSTEGFALPFFATPESHNTPRAAARDGGIVYSKYAWAIGNFIPAIPFIHSGFELGETYPINTGLDFSHEELARYPSQRLPLFSEHAYDWTGKDRLIDWIRTVSSVRRKYASIIVDPSPATFRWIESPQDVITFVRGAADARKQLLVIGNSNMHGPARFSIDLPFTRKKVFKDLLSGASCAVKDHALTGVLPAGAVRVFEV